MKQLKENILDLLTQLKGSGKFASIGTENFILPGLQVDDLGVISFPLNETQAKEIITVSHKAAFGMGSDTIIDEEIRKTWELDSKNYQLTNPKWENVLTKIINTIKVELGLKEYTIEAKPYKLLIYEKGGFFLTHKDTEKEKDMFGTLIIGLPSKHKGGELVIEFNGETEVASFENDFCIDYAAFYTDCDHEVRPLISGYRMCLVYNLVQKKVITKISPPSIGEHSEKIANIIGNYEIKNPFKPYIILLNHQYTPENFSQDNLKLGDRVKAEALILAAEKLGFYSKLCLVTSYLAGTPEINYDDYDYRYGNRNEEDYEDAEMDEVYEKSLSIEHWVDNKVPKLNRVNFIEEDLIVSFKLDDEEPIVKESAGYMGNYGPDLMHWYHYGAIMIWSPQTNSTLLLAENSESQLNWINYFSTLDVIHIEEMKTIQAVILSGIKNSVRDSLNYNGIIKWIIKHKQKSLLLNLNSETLHLYFCHIDIEHWIGLFKWLTKDEGLTLFRKLTTDVSLFVLEKLTCLFDKMNDSNLLQDLVIEYIGKLPRIILELYQLENTRVNTDVILVLFELERKLKLSSEWVEEMDKSLTYKLKREYINKKIVPILINEILPSKLKENLKEFCKNYLKNRVINKPSEPKNWTQSLPDSAKKNESWNILEDFLASPTEVTFDFRRNQAERDRLEALVKSYKIDLKTETIKIGSPHTLRISKTKASYQLEMKKWHEDLELLNNINSI